MKTSVEGAGLFRFLVSVFYSKAKIAAACSGIIYLLTYVPCMYISIREDLAQDIIPKWAKMLAVSDQHGGRTDVSFALC